MTALSTKILCADALDSAAQALRSGDVVAIPTETVYGLAGNAFNVDAVTRIFAVKERPSFDPLIVHVAPQHKSVDGLGRFGIIDPGKMSAGQIALTEKLMAAFCPGPLTLILPKSKLIPDLVTSGLDQVGVRFPSHPLAQALLRLSDLPLAAPSANRFGRISPTTAAHVLDELGGRISLIVDGGPCEVGVESTVVAVDSDKIWLLRPGKISAEDLKRATGVAVARASSVHEKASPGMLESHYAPRKPMFIVTDWSNPLPSPFTGDKNLKIGLMCPEGSGQNEKSALERAGWRVPLVRILSRGADSESAAKALFATMRELDQSDIDVILTGGISKTDHLWPAIADRISRAAKTTT